MNQESLVKMEPLDHKDQKGNVAHMHGLENQENVVNQESLAMMENLVNQESLVTRDKKERQLDSKSLRIRLVMALGSFVRSYKTAVTKMMVKDTMVVMMMMMTMMMMMMTSVRDQQTTTVLAHHMERYISVY